MTIHAHIDEFAGLKVQEYMPKDGIRQAATHAMRIALDYDAFEEGETFASRFAAFVSDKSCPEVQAFIVGDWGGAGQGEESAAVVEAIVNARDRLPKLRALFVGEIVGEESEISWITQSDVSPLFHAFPQLQELYLRGGNGLRLGKPRHANLRKLVIETGGMSANLVREVTSAELPKLEHLELWLGDDGYGNDITSDDLRDLLVKGPVANLKYLGLRDDCKADETAKLLAEIGIPSGVQTLDISLGTLGDEGAQELAAAGWIRSLVTLDIHHHYVSQYAVEKLKNAGPQVDASDRQEPHEYSGESRRYIAVSE